MRLGKDQPAGARRSELCCDLKTDLVDRMIWGRAFELGIVCSLTLGFGPDPAGLCVQRWFLGSGYRRVEMSRGNQYAAITSAYCQSLSAGPINRLLLHLGTSLQDH